MESSFCFANVEFITVPATSFIELVAGTSNICCWFYKAGCWNCDEFYIGKTKRRLHDRKTEHFKALAKSDHSSAIADHVKTTGHDIKWDHFDILSSSIKMHWNTMFITAVCVIFLNNLAKI